MQEIGDGDLGTYQGWKTGSQERGWTTVATVTAVTCAQQEASVVRVHDLEEMTYVVIISTTSKSIVGILSTSLNVVRVLTIIAVAFPPKDFRYFIQISLVSSKGRSSAVAAYHNESEF